MNENDWQNLEGTPTLTRILIKGVELRPGAKVRLWPGKGGDIMDLAMAEKVATVESIEQDYEGNIYLAVVLDDDPGRDLGLLKFPGHRFFFSPEEVEPLGLVDNQQVPR